MRGIGMHGRRLDDPNLETRLARIPKAEMHFRFEGAFRWSTIRKMHPRGKELPERQPWLAQERNAIGEFDDAPLLKPGGLSRSSVLK